MNQNDLESVMLFHLQNFNDEAETLSNDTVHNKVLSTTDGFGAANSKNIYRSFIRWTLKKQKHKDKPWPKDWMDTTVKDLAGKLLIFFIMLMPFAAQSQLQVTIGAGKTDLRDNAVTIGITYLQNLDSIWRNNDYLIVGKNSLLQLAPELNMQTGTQDAFSSINLKMTGLFARFKTTAVSGIETPDSKSMFQTFPVSFGVETNNLFNTINGIFEAGWVPWYQNATTSQLLKRTKVGLFMQTGYKFYVDSTGKNAIGGEIDQSEELPDKAIVRAKGSMSVDTKQVIKVNGLNVGLVGSADLWYDFVNNTFYNRIEGRGRFYLDAERYIDIIYQKGSGAPNFNQGDQYGVGLTVTF